MTTHRLFSHDRSRRGIAFVATLMLFAIFMMMVAVALRANARHRARLRVQRNAAQALCLAESGIAEALHLMATTNTKTNCARTIGKGEFSARWSPVKDARGIMEIVSVGESRASGPTTIRKVVRVRVRTAPAGGSASRPVILSWQIH